MSRSETATLKQGMVLQDKWLIMELIGRGAMGEVYRAHQTNLKRDVAIKVISEDIMAEIEEDPDELEIAYGRFQREVQTMARVRHPNILTIYDYGEIEGAAIGKQYKTAFIVMEYIPGNTLRFTLSEDGWDDVPQVYGQWIRDYFLPILDGAEILHNNQIVHRDLKPENIFMDGDVPKIADFGLSRSYQMKAVTSSIEMLGTLAYMSPEQCADFKNSDVPSDIYALGKILFEAVHGTLTEKIVPFTSVSLDSPQGEFLVAMNQIIRKATSEDPTSRYSSVLEFRSALKEALGILERQDSPTAPPELNEPSGKEAFPARSIWLVIGGIIAISSVVGMAYFHLTDKGESVTGLSGSTYAHHDEPAGGPETIILQSGETPAPSIMGRDGSNMVLTGDVTGQKNDIVFYMDERRVSNFSFIEFLNRLGDTISVENGVVRRGETILLYLGGGSAHEDVIVYEHDTFHLSDQDDGSKPVVRVTYHGAHLYAATYGKDLLNEKEWRYGYRFHKKNIENVEESDLNVSEQSGMMSMMHAAPEALPEQATGPVVLDGMGKEVKEWVRILGREAEDNSDSADNVYKSGVLSAERMLDNGRPLRRQPWEGFGDVGFRAKTRVIQK